jgi:hypothetical protein
MLGDVDGYGFVTGFPAGPANTEERWLPKAFVRWRLAPHASACTPPELAMAPGPTHRAGGQRRGPSGLWRNPLKRLAVVGACR